MKIPFGKTFQITPAELKDGVAQGLVDGYIDYGGAFRSRYGLTQLLNLGSYPIDGMYVSVNGYIVVVTGGLVYVDGMVCTGVDVPKNTPCTFAEDSFNVFFANGGRIIKINLDGKTITELASTTAPSNVSHVIYTQGYLLANGSGGIAGDTFYTGPYTTADYLDTWEVYNNESLPDGCKALMEDGQFVYNFGSQSIEIAVNDGVTPWAKYGVGFVPYGCFAPNSIAKVDGTFFWLGVADNALRVMKLNGGQAQTISTPYDSVINSMNTTVDAYAFTMGFDGNTFYCLQFPMEDLTLVYHIQQDAWYRWAYYDVDTSKYNAYLGRCHAYNHLTNLNMIGDRNTGKIYSVEGFTDDGALIRFELTSGNVSAGTYKLKRADRMRFQLLRGTTTDLTANPVLRWAHRDDGNSWAAERKITLGLKGHYNYLGQLDRCGLYRERQHRLIFTDANSQLVFVEVEEEPTVSREK